MLERGDEVNSEHHPFLQQCAIALIRPAELLEGYLDGAMDFAWLGWEIGTQAGGRGGKYEVASR